MSGFEEVAAAEEAWAAWEAYAAAAAAAEGAGAGAAAAGAGAGAGAAAGLTAAEMAALEASAAQGLSGAGELSLLGEGAASGLAGSGGTAADASLASALSQQGYLTNATGADQFAGLLGNGSGVDALDAAGQASKAADFGLQSQFGGYGAGNTVTDSLVAAPESYANNGLLSDPSSVLASDGSGNAFASQYDAMKYKAMNALGKVGGAYNKLPAPVQGLLVSQAIPKPSAPPPQAQRPAPHPQSAPPPLQPTYNAQPFQAQNTASKYGAEASTEGLLANLTPQQIEMLKRMMAQRGMQ